MDPMHGLSEQLRNRQLVQFVFERLKPIAVGNGVGDDDLIDLRFSQTLQGQSHKHGMSGGGDHGFGAAILHELGRLADRSRG